MAKPDRMPVSIAVRACRLRQWFGSDAEPLVPLANDATGGFYSVMETSLTVAASGLLNEFVLPISRRQVNVTQPTLLAFNLAVQHDTTAQSTYEIAVVARRMR